MINNIVFKVTDIEWTVDNKKDLEYLPDTMEISLGLLPTLSDLEGISDYISNKTGFCHKGFYISCNVTTEELYKKLDEIDAALDEEYKDSETNWAANLECLREEIESLICILEESNEIEMEEI